MALHTCNKCTARYPDDLKTCPQCETPREKPKTTRKTSSGSKGKGGSK